MYALCILIGIVVAIWLTGRRLVPRGGEPGQALDVARLGRPLRHRRRPALPRHHDPGPLLGRGRPPAGRPQGLGGRARHLGRHLARGAGGVDRMPSRRPVVPGLRGCRGARRRVRAGDRPVRQLVQQRALRRPDDAAVGAGDPRVGPVGRPGRGRRGGRAGRARASSTRRSSTRRSSSSCSASGCSSSTGGAPRAGPAPRALRRRLPGRADRHRDDAHRRGRARPRASGSTSGRASSCSCSGVWIFWYTGRRARRAEPSRWANPSPRMWDSPAQMARRRGPGISFRHVARAVRA